MIKPTERAGLSETPRTEEASKVGTQEKVGAGAGENTGATPKASAEKTAHERTTAAYSRIPVNLGGSGAMGPPTGRVPFGKKAQDLRRAMFMPALPSGTTSLPRPSTKDEIAKAGPEDKITLWRATSEDQLENIKKHGTAGGVEGANPEVEAPSEEAARMQVGGASMQGYNKAANRLPEYTDKPETARQFSKGGHIVAIEIPKKYLTQGSGTEGGWVAHPNAPVEVKGSVLGEPLPFQGDPRWAGVSAD
jgi:hypothetical protein